MFSAINTRWIENCLQCFAILVVADDFMVFQIMAYIFFLSQSTRLFIIGLDIYTFLKVSLRVLAFSVIHFKYSQCFRNITLLKQINGNLVEAICRIILIHSLNPQIPESEVDVLKVDSIYRWPIKQKLMDDDIFTFKKFMGTWTKSSSNFQDDFKNLLNSQKPNQLMMHLVMVVEVKSFPIFGIWVS